MNTLQTNMMIGIGFSFIVLFISLLTVTLIVVNQIYNNNINLSMVKFIEVSNWILVAILIIITLASVFLIPFLWKYRKIDLTNLVKLEPAKNHPASFE